MLRETEKQREKEQGLASAKPGGGVVSTHQDSSMRVGGLHPEKTRGLLVVFLAEIHGYGISRGATEEISEGSHVLSDSPACESEG